MRQTLMNPTRDPATALPSAPLRQAIATLYQVFADEPVPAVPLDACTHCCMPPEQEAEMRRWPLRDITAAHFYRYNSAASSGSQPASEVRYLLPRLLELLAQGAELHFALECTLRRLGDCPADAFSQDQRRAIDTYARAHFTDFLARHAWLDAAVPNRWSADNAFAVLLMWDIGGVDIRPLLADWARGGRPSACCHYAEAGNADFWPDDTMDNAFAQERPAFRHTVNEWMRDEANRAHFSHALRALRASTDAFRQDCDCGAHPTPEDAIDNAVSQLERHAGKTA